MEELFQLIIFLVVFGSWILSAVSQAKKRRQQELDDVFEEMEHEGTEKSTSSRPAPRPTSPKKTGWEEIQRELRRMLEEETTVQPSAPPPPPSKPRPQPRPQPTQSAPRPTPTQTVVTKPRPERPRPSRSKPQSPPVKQKTVEVRNRPTRETERPTFTQSEPLKRRSALLERRKKLVRTAKKRTGVRSGGLTLHSNPIANALILGEVLRGPRGYIPLCGGIRRARD